MTHGEFRNQMMGMVALMGCLLVLGCQPSVEVSENPPKPLAKKKPKTLLENWDAPSAVFVFSGDVHGYMEPCGCTAGQTGGFAHRADLLQKLREERKWPVAAFDNGGSLDEARISYEQSKIKLAAIRSGLNTMGYQGSALGKEELMLGGTQLYTMHAETDAQEGFDVPFMAANVTIFGTKDLGTPTSTRVVEVGGLKVGVTAIVGQSTKDKLDATGITRDEGELKIEAPDEVLTTQIAKLTSEGVDLIVLMSHSSIEESTAFAKSHPDLDIVVTAGSAEDPRNEEIWVENTLLVKVGKKGKNVAVVGVFPEATPKLKMEIVELDADRFNDHPSMIAMMADYQKRLEEAWPILSSASIADPGDQFVGADQCKTCHSFAYGVWSKTRHNHAYESLIHGRTEKGADGESKYSEDWVSRIYDPECLCCHTTGWDPQTAQRYESGFIDVEKTPHLAGQQCENCHGPAGEHVKLERALSPGAPPSEDAKRLRENLRLTLTAARETVCVRCHDLDNSPKFDFETYWPKVNHSGRKD